MGYTLLHLSVALGELDAICYLINDKNADVNLEDVRGYRPLKVAIELCPDPNTPWAKKDKSECLIYSDIIITLVKNGADVNCISSEEESAIKYATIQGNQIVLETLNSVISRMVVLK